MSPKLALVLLFVGFLTAASGASAATYHYTFNDGMSAGDTVTGTVDVATSPNDTVTAADVTNSDSDLGTFSTILTQSMQGSDWYVQLENSANTWYFNLYLNATNLFSGQTTPIDKTYSDFALVANPGEVERNIDSGELVLASSTPIPSALPLFAGGIAVIGLLSRRRRAKIASV